MKRLSGKTKCSRDEGERREEADEEEVGVEGSADISDIFSLQVVTDHHLTLLYYLLYPHYSSVKRPVPTFLMILHGTYLIRARTNFLLHQPPHFSAAHRAECVVGT